MEDRIEDRMEDGMEELGKLFPVTRIQIFWKEKPSLFTKFSKAKTTFLYISEFSIFQ